MAQWNEGVKAFTAGEALATRRRVKLNSSGNVVYANGGDDFIGVTEHAAANAAVVSVRMKSSAGTMKVTAAGAFSIGAYLYGAVDGKVDDACAGTAQFIALEAATANGDIIEAVPSELEVANIANLEHGIPLVIRVNVADGAGDTVVWNANAPFKFRVTDAWAVKTAANGGAGDTVQVVGAAAITNAMSLNAVDTTIVRAGTIDDANHEIAANGTLKVTAAKVTNTACIVYIRGMRVA